MEAQKQKTVAIILNNAEPLGTLEEMTKTAGYAASTMQVYGNTQPTQPSTFVDEVVPNLVFLAENFSRTSEGKGIATLVEIKKNHPDLPIVMVSGNPQYREIAMENGAKGYLDIPIKDDAYRELLESTLNNNSPF